MIPQCAEFGVNIVGNEISQSSAATSFECQNLCVAESSCSAWTWSESQQTCSLKSSADGDVEMSSDFVSGPQLCDSPMCPRGYVEADDSQCESGDGSCCVAEITERCDEFCIRGRCHAAEGTYTSLSDGQSGACRMETGCLESNADYEGFDVGFD